ncbi:MAG: hypothetical protein COX62_03630 [Deltaproteobacteria bacterium CG_4_10_14_0_2_um_filter_43_8]|nr:MAG: hypothetical protein COV43_05715 [Deltaproteobacteria bacterium CG11_big_fil_rev_8_21_14_0_20_42_23]PJA20974.1 MAG: hypothetical protein COX62_03630 [Deltaproteobacteria bacterium CG_4_10_14_0_2_um_filter_43_8]PJC63662.1 MAG: hypothetical protein CO021_08235 [Deltaproteobacteria bacterium CG_4_9_14_0_2_um_filter_42_21]
MRIKCAFIFFFLFLFPLVSFAYILPEIHLSQTDLQLSADHHYSDLLKQKSSLSNSLSFSKYEEYKKNPKLRLNKQERIAAAGFAKLLPNLEFWTYVFRLKQDILNLHEIKTNNIKNEADLLARETILSLYKSSREFKIKSWPLLHNTFIKLSKNARGYCYHYVENLKRDLGSQNWNFFTLAWVEAYSGKYREHNTLAIAKKGETIENSIIVDGWRNGSKPFWIRREDDHYPWKLYQVINNSAHKAPSSLSAAPQKAPKTEAP